ncbi:ADP-heptose synthase [Klebsiella pneumoniae]|uniref:ADP-heptose synthase n=1 Tax=Klebsiella pneumoniae TaxID=573 RepID=A0A2X3EV79_KLEPN|nr:ADP-heptose synthase [Klebsiella pneumoniae]
MSEEELKQAVAAARKRGEKVVMTNGVFDILHAGHVSYLANARKLGDRLIVAVNSDASTKTSERRNPPR